ncbi:MAG: PhnD/SsuA/transferrin family substrate-binding protein [Paracoccaceae bacterium]
MLRRRFVSCSLALVSGMAMPYAPVIAQPRTIRFGLTPVFLSHDLDLLNNLQEYLARATGYRVDLVRKRTYQEITTLLVAGQLDAAWICGFPYIRYREALELLSVPVWRGRPLYQSYLIGAADRDATGIDDLKGDVHCFSDPDSNSGYLVTSYQLARRGLHPDEFFTTSFFAYGHRNVVRAVAARLASSGSVDGYVWEVLNESEPELTRKTKVIWKSEWLGFPPIAAPKAAAGSAQFAALQEAFFKMNGDPQGQKILELLRLDGFGPPEGADFDRIGQLVKLVRELG